MQGYLFLCLLDLRNKKEQDCGGELDWKFMTEESNGDEDNLVNILYHGILKVKIVY